METTMATTKPLPARQPLKREPTHPGEILREDVLPALRMSVSQAARELGVSRQLLHRILARRAPVTPEMAVRLGKWAGNGPALWLGMQQAFDVWHAEQSLSEELERIPRHATAA
jgi:antitoxin HigA-1